MNEMDFKEYLAFLRDLGVTLGEITTVEQEKAKFVRMDDLDGLNECMKREQALSMTLRSCDQKRDAMLLLLGLEGVPLRDLLDHAPRRTGRRRARRWSSFAGSTRCFAAPLRWLRTRWSAICIKLKRYCIWSLPMAICSRDIRKRPRSSHPV